MPSTKHKLPLEFSSEAWDRLQEIKALIGAQDDAFAIREGLRVLEWLVKQTNDGWKLQLTRGNIVRKFKLSLKTD